MPDITASLHGAEFFIVGADFDFTQYFLGRYDLIRPHRQKLFVSSKHAIAGEDIEKRMLGKKSFGKIHEIRNRSVGRIRPPAGKLKAVAGAFSFFDGAFA